VLKGAQKYLHQGIEVLFSRRPPRATSFLP